MDTPSNPFSSSSADAAVQRAEPRNSIFLGATLWFDDEPERHSVRVRNISAGGMMVDFPIVCEKDRPLKVELRGLGVLSGKVAWSTESRMGVRFDRQIDPEKARVRPAASPVPGVIKPIIADRRPGLAVR